MEIILATHNDHKVREINNIVNVSSIQFVSLREIGWHDEIIEDGSTIEENAWIKANAVWDKLKKPVVSEDTGLLIDALNGAPGVHTARYAGPEKDAQKNMQKVLVNLENASSRNAHFKTVMAFIHQEGRSEFTGICRGHISKSLLGTEGFGYDPIFIPENYEKSFGQLSSEIKDRISHRSKAVSQLVDFIKKMG